MLKIPRRIKSPPITQTILSKKVSLKKLYKISLLDFFAQEQTSTAIKNTKVINKK